MVSLISRLYDFVSGTKIRSSQVDEEFNQLVEAYNLLVELLTTVGADNLIQYGNTGCKFIRLNADNAIEVSITPRGK